MQRQPAAPAAAPDNTRPNRGGFMKKDINQLFVYPKSRVSKETGDIIKSVRQWADKEIVNRRLEYLDDLENAFPRARSRLALDIGCQGLMFPPNSGGLGFAIPDARSDGKTDAATPLIHILKEIGRADAGIGLIHAMEYALCALIATSGDDRAAIDKELAPLFCQDRLHTAALILPACGPAGGTYPLFEGRPVRASLETGDAEAECRISCPSLRPLDLGAEAAVFALVCADPDKEPAVALVPGDAEGLRRGAAIRKTGLEGCANADIEIKGLRLAPALLLRGAPAVRSLYAWTGLLLGAVSTGAAMGCMEVAGQWAAERMIKGGERLKDNPLCASVLAEAYEEMAVSWALLHHMAAAFTQPGEWGAPASPMMFAQAQMTGRRVQAGAMQAVDKMMELMASEGYAREGRMEKAWRDIKTIQSGLCGAGAEAPVRLDVARYVFDSAAQ